MVLYSIAQTLNGFMVCMFGVWAGIMARRLGYKSWEYSKLLEQTMRMNKALHASCASPASNGFERCRS
jgi:hypothetical protein